MLGCLGVAGVLPASRRPCITCSVMPPGRWQPAPAGRTIAGSTSRLNQGRRRSDLADHRHRFDPSQPAPRKAGFLIGAVYRIRVTNIRLAEGLEVFPTIEIIDRLYAPPDQQRRFAIPVDIAEDDLKLAIDGKFVTRVIYLEDPRHALPARDDPQMQNWFEAAPGQDPLAVADGLGRPVAILRLGARLPDPSEMQAPAFFYGSPPFTALPPAPETIKPRPAVAPPAVKNLPPSAVKNLPPPPGCPRNGRERGRGGERQNQTHPSTCNST